MQMTSLRRWRRNPLLAVHHFGTVALGMAAVTAVISLMLAAAFQPLPFRDFEQLVQVWHRVESGAQMEGLSGEDLLEIEDGASSVFSSFGGYINILLWARDGERTTGALRSVRMEEAAFRALDVRPVLGRPIDRRSSNDGRSVWIGYNLWQSRYGGRPSVIGETIRLSMSEAGANVIEYEIAGVLPPGIRIPFPTAFFEEPIDVWSVLPDDMRVRWATNRSFHALGRLHLGRSLSEAEAALTVLADRRAQASGRRHRPVVRSFDEIASGPARRTLGVLAAGVAMVMLLAFANLASLTVAEGSRRRVELAVRAALGASRWRLWRELAAEHAALTACALIAGLPLAWIALQAGTRLMASADIGPQLTQAPTLDANVMLGFSACALVAALGWATLIVGRLSADDRIGERSAGALWNAVRQSPADRRSKLLRLGVLSLQACVGLALMVLAVSMAGTYVRITEVDLGPSPDRTTFFSVRPQVGRALTSAEAADLWTQVRLRVQALPGVEAVAAADNFPPRGSALSFWKPGDAPESPRATTYPVRVTHDYFSVLGIPVLFGRGFDESDRFGSTPVVVIDLEMARRNWTRPEDAVNARITLGSRATFEVIGVAGSFSGYWSQIPTPTIYVSQEQDPGSSNVLILRTDAPAPGIAEQARQALGTLPLRVEVSVPQTIQAAWQATATRPRARMIGMLLLALIGIALGAQGVYALSASNVVARQQELAIRTALGAPPPALVWLVLRPLLFAVAVGAVAGVAAILTVQRVAPHWIAASVGDPTAPIGCALAGLLTTAALGAVVPARGACGVTPVRWLR